MALTIASYDRVGLLAIRSDFPPQVGEPSSMSSLLSLRRSTRFSLSLQTLAYYYSYALNDVDAVPALVPGLRFVGRLRVAGGVGGAGAELVLAGLPRVPLI